MVNTREIVAALEQFIADVKLKIPNVKYLVSIGLTPLHVHHIDFEVNKIVVSVQYAVAFRGGYWGFTLIGHPTKELDVGYTSVPDHIYDIGKRDEALEHIINTLLDKA